jgi:hypothetical protein
MKHGQSEAATGRGTVHRRNEWLVVVLERQRFPADS